MATYHGGTKINDLEQVTTIETLTDLQKEKLDHINTLGSVQLQNVQTKEIFLIPTPSSDPNDPLNWYRPSVAIVETTIDYFGPPGPDFTAKISKIAYFYTTTALLQGLGNLVWMPFIVKYGRRPVYLASFTLYTITAIWIGVSKTYANTLVARIVMGFAAGSGECLAPLTISDIFFLHERGTIMAIYTASLNFGVAIGIILSGIITHNLGYRYIYYIATALIGFLTIVVFFTMPETSYIRSPIATPSSEDTTSQHPPKRSYINGLKLYTGTYTSESFWKLFMRPVIMLLLPPVIWATLVMSVTIGFLVAISSNFASAFSTTYGFESWQSGLCFVAGLVGPAIAIVFGGHFSDWTANYFTKRNGGIREPEFRLPSITIGLVTAPLGLVLYGAGIEHRWHWMVPTLGLGLLTFSITQATNVSLVYIVDAYRPIAGETVVTQLGFKSAFGFLLSFYTNPWIEKSGYQNAFGAMAGISAAVLVCWIPFFVFGKRIRHASLKWPIIQRAVKWSVDREVGE
ncbi:putative MFS-type transporter [Pseudocercospora fuligena]|uniref:Putative MFS-type transporter n=1 Tax=Pseudocercospora fuligena TaxID=685502 RepID=A0A8H6RIX8_9PEZI|nr:putative MFS-type transporter [Pseudocercospora fuligena]